MSLQERLRGLSPGVQDALLAAVVAVPTVMDAWWNAPGTRQADALTYLLVAASLLPLLVRRRWPIPVAVACGLALTGLYVLGHHGELLNLPVMVALYTVAVRGDRRTTLVTAAVAVAWSGILGYTSDDPIGARGGSPMLEMVMPLVPLALGEAVRARRELAELAAAEREREALRRVDEERARMARDLHDVVAHTMAAVNVQMAAAVAAFDTDPETARAALVEARGSSRAALRELRSTVSLLRLTPETAPAPGLDQIDRLTSTAAAAGVAVTVDDGRDGVVLPGGVDLTAYRIVQEALTNVVRHSGARNVTVSVRPEGGSLVIEVVDDGVATTAFQPGLGLTGMAERARSVGGRLEHGPRAGGGYRVRAELPLEGEGA